MGDFNTLTDISKHRRMFADDIARTDGGEANGARNAFAGMTFTTVDGAFLQIFVQDRKSVV